MIKIETFVNSSDPLGEVDTISCIKPIKPAVISPAWGPRKKVVYMMKGIPRSGLKNSMGRKLINVASKVVRISPIIR